MHADVHDDLPERREAAYLFRLYIEASGRTDVPMQFDPPCSIAGGPMPHQSPAGPGVHSPTAADASLHILELGSGVGYVGLACARALKRAAADTQPGAQPLTTCSPTRQWRNAVVVLTDLENVCDLMSRNARLAGFDPTGREESADHGTGPSDGHVNVLVRALPWGSEAHASAVLTELQGRRQKHALPTASGSSAGTAGDDTDVPTRHPLDYILCSDLVYFPALLAPLLRSLISLTTPTSRTSAAVAQPPPVLIAYKIRSFAKEEPFWNALGIWFDVDIVACRHLEQQRRDQADASTSTPTRYGAWHHFGAWKCDLDLDLDQAGTTPTQGSAGTDATQDAGPPPQEGKNEDSYFIFVAQRKVETYSYDAPTEDRKLMDGWMAEPSVVQKEEELIRGQGGADFLEWALMGGMDMDEEFCGLGERIHRRGVTIPA